MLSNKKAFTIVELLVVVVVIAILAAIAIVSYNGISNMSKDSSISSALSQMSKKISIYHIKNNELYPDDLSSADPVLNSEVEFSYNVSSDRKDYCLDGRAYGRVFYIKKDSGPKKGYCDGLDGVDTDGSASSMVEITPSMSYGDERFKVVMNDDWSTALLNWSAGSNVQKYQIQIEKGDGNWVYVNKNTGGTQSVGVHSCAALETGTYSQNCSSNIEPSVTSLSWYDGNSRVQSSSSKYGYRLRAVGEGASSEWVTVYVEPSLTGRTKVKNLKAVPVSDSDISQMIVSWDAVAKNNIPNPQIHVQVRRNSGEWENVNKATGSVIAVGSHYCRSINENSTFYKDYCSFTIPANETRVVWGDKNVRPNLVDDLVDFRIRLRSNTVLGVVSDWTQFNYRLPPKESLSTPVGFAADSSSDWSSINLSWTNPANNIFNSNTHIQVRKSNGEWENVNKATGSVIAVGSHYCRNINESSTFYKEHCSFTIPNDTTSVVWSNANAIPSAGQEMGYRIRYTSTSVIGHASEWVYATLSR